MASIHQQGSGVRLDSPDVALGDESADEQGQEPSIYVSPPLVGESPDYPGGVSEPIAIEAPLEGDELGEPASLEAASWTDTITAVGREIDTRLRRELQEHPYRSLAAAVALGYLLHDGVTSKGGRFALLLGGRYALKAFASSMAGAEE